MIAKRKRANRTTCAALQVSLLLLASAAKAQTPPEEPEDQREAVQSPLDVRIDPEENDGTRTHYS